MVVEYNYCLRCGRKLTSKENRLRGYGMTCYKKVKGHGFKPLFEVDRDRINIRKLRNAVIDNDLKFQLGVISEEEYQRVGNILTDEVTQLEIKFLS